MTNRFIDNGDGTITDTKTGIMWQRADDGIKRSWDEAHKYAETLNLAGHNDWRLPAIHELLSIVDYSRYLPAIDPVFYCKSNWYWSGTSYADTTGYAWIVSFCYGHLNADGKASISYVRCARGGPSSI